MFDSIVTGSDLAFLDDDIGNLDSAFALVILRQGVDSAYASHRDPLPVVNAGGDVGGMNHAVALSAAPTSSQLAEPAPAPPARRVRRTPEQKAELIARFEASGLKVARFCRREGLSPTTLPLASRRQARPPSRRPPACCGCRRAKRRRRPHRAEANRHRRLRNGGERRRRRAPRRLRQGGGLMLGTPLPHRSTSPAPTDMRKGFNGLCGLIESAVGAGSGTSSRSHRHRRRAVRLRQPHPRPGQGSPLDGDGLAIEYETVRPGRFELPASTHASDRVDLDATQLRLILDGIDLSSVKRRKRYAHRDQRSPPPDGLAVASNELQELAHSGTRRWPRSSVAKPTEATAPELGATASKLHLATAENVTLRETAEHLQARLDHLTRMMFGRRSERLVDPGAEPPVHDGEAEAQADEPAAPTPCASEQRSPRAAGKQIDPRLRRVEIRHELPAEELTDPVTGELLYGPRRPGHREARLRAHGAVRREP